MAKTDRGSLACRQRGRATPGAEHVEAAARLWAAITDPVLGELSLERSDDPQSPVVVRYRPYRHGPELSMWLEEVAPPSNIPQPVIIDAVGEEERRKRVAELEGIRIEAAATVIAGSDDVPAWLFDGLRGAAGWLVALIMKDENYPRGLAEWRGKSDAMAADAELLLEIAPSAEIRAALRGVIERAKANSECIPRKQGRGRYYLGVPVKGAGEKTAAARRKRRLTEPGLSPREWCGLVVAVAWKAHRGRYPGERYPDRHVACEVLWRACGGSPSKKTDDSGRVGVDNDRADGPWREACHVADRRREDYGAIIARFFFYRP